MPYESNWVAPDVLLTHKGVTIYHIYKNDDSENRIRCFEYGWVEDCSDYDTCTSFDVRELPNPAGHVEHARIIRDAIDAGIITKDGVKLNQEEKHDTAGKT